MFSRTFSLLTAAATVISLSGFAAAQNGAYYIRSATNSSIFVQADEFDAPLTLSYEGDPTVWNVTGVDGGNAEFWNSMVSGYAWSNGIPSDPVRLGDSPTVWHLDKVLGSDDDEYPNYKIHIDSKPRFEIYWTIHQGSNEVYQERLSEDDFDLTQTWQLIPVSA